ncbi:MAG: aromatic ring-hydroxylating dioxygenase subunit alpha [Chloroflexales bacterium]|nr:aromatic ring-hydroxylating dioxygenase subunit alpha [Chloroflexales bacterium]
MTTTVDAPARDTLPEQLRALVAARTPGYSLAQEFYVSPDVFAIDLERIFGRYWLFAGHVSQIPRPGDYFLYQIGAESLIVIRDEAGQIHALYNVCRHRGSHVLLEQQGHANRLVCPYHAWAYGHDGALLACMHMPPDFDKSQHGLHRAQVRVTEGLIYLHLGQAPPPFEPFANDLSHFLADYELANATIAHHARYDVACNWKLLCENFCECYHCGPAHPEYCEKVMYAAVAARPNSISASTAQAVEAQAREHFAHVGLASGGCGGEWYYCGRNAMRPGFVSMSADGQQLAPLLGRLRHPDAGNFSFFSYPNGICEASADHAVLIQFTPLAPKQTRADVYWLVRAGAEPGRDYDLDQLLWFWKTTAEQDWAICRNNQAGVDSRHYQPGPYSLVEQGVERFVQWYLDAITC